MNIINRLVPASNLAKSWFHSYEFLPSKNLSKADNFDDFERNVIKGICDDLVSGSNPLYSFYRHDKKIKVTIIVEYDYE